jgi:hypothetical protein
MSHTDTGVLPLDRIGLNTTKETDQQLHRGEPGFYGSRATLDGLIGATDHADFDHSLT